MVESCYGAKVPLSSGLHNAHVYVCRRFDFEALETAGLTQRMSWHMTTPRAPHVKAKLH